MRTISDEIPTEAAAYRYLEKLRWGDRPECAHCGSESVCLIPPANGVSRKTRTGAMTERRVWRCRECRRQFSVLTGTVMHGTKVSVRTWVLVFFEMCLSKNGVAAREIERKYGVCPRTAWHLTHRIREAMRCDGLLSMTGTIVADESWVGGDPTKRTGHARPKPVRVVPGQNVKTDKQPILSIVNADTGEVRSRTVTDTSTPTLRKVIAEHVNMAGSVLHTDEGAWYKAIGREFQAHETVNHRNGEYARNGVSTNRAEGYFSQVKRSISGTHHSVSKKHLQRYLDEFDFRYSTSKMTDGERMARLLGQVEKRLPYSVLTARA